MWELVSSSCVCVFCCCLFVFICFFVFALNFFFFFPIQITQTLEGRIKHTKIWFNVCVSFPFDVVDVSKLSDKNSTKFHDPLFLFSSISVLSICEVAVITSVLPFKGVILPVLAQWRSIFYMRSTFNAYFGIYIAFLLQGFTQFILSELFYFALIFQCIL